MTLKQFFQLAAGGLVALLFYTSPLPGAVKWPAVLLSGGLGFALAFLPLEERPLSTWIVLFLKSIYSPTLYQKREGKIPEIFAPEGSELNLNQAVATPKTDERASETPSAGQGQVVSVFEEQEKSFFKRLASVFHQIPVVQATQPQFVVEQIDSVPLPIQTPKVEPIKVAPPPAPIPTPPVQDQERSATGASSNITPTLSGYQTQNAAPARFVLSASPPSPPQTPNVAVGQVLDEGGNVVEGAILEIRDSAGRPARALRTNKVGHFLTATPLVGGKYEIIIEKDGYEFSPIQFSAIDNLIPPIEIRGKKLAAAN